MLSLSKALYQHCYELFGGIALKNHASFFLLFYVASHLQRIQNYAALVILRHPRSSNITTHLKSLHWLPVKVSSYKKAGLCYHCHSSTAPLYVAVMLKKMPSHPATLAPAHTPCLLLTDLHTVKQHLLIAHFLLLLLLSGTLFQMMSGVPHHCYHSSLV